MADVHSKETRSYNMSRIRAKNTKPEMIVRKFLFSKGYRYRLHNKKLPGTPDIVLAKHKTVVFINGCFWHGHENCKYAFLPKTRTQWWKAKINRNMSSDNINVEKLMGQKWQVIIIWQCELKKDKNKVFEMLIQKLGNSA